MTAKVNGMSAEDARHAVMGFWCSNATTKDEYHEAVKAIHEAFEDAEKWREHVEYESRFIDRDGRYDCR